jgi:hypothetical protein
MDPDITTIIEAAIQAPSGENVQPWRFHVVKKNIQLHHVDVDSEIYDTGNRGSFVAHGAALENMMVVAAALGYTPTLTLFPQTGLRSHVATLSLGTLNTSAVKDSAAIDTIYGRVTNRNAYKKEPLKKEFIEELKKISNASKHVTVSRILDKESITRLARVGSTNEEVMLQNKTLHSFFFEHVTWTKKEDTEKRVGFYIKTLGLPLPAQKLFKLFSNWGIMIFLKKVGFPAVIGKQNADTYSAASEIIMLSISQDTPESFIKVGMLMEKIWLECTRAGVSVQPLAGTLFMRFFIAENKTAEKIFSVKERALITDAITKAEEIGRKKEASQTIAFMMRLGYGIAPEARSSRYPIQHFLV